MKIKYFYKRMIKIKMKFQKNQINPQKIIKLNKIAINLKNHKVRKIKAIIHLIHKMKKMKYMKIKN